MTRRNRLGCCFCNSSHRTLLARRIKRMRAELRGDSWHIRRLHEILRPAEKAWQRETGNPRTLPDTKKLVDWLMRRACLDARDIRRLRDTRTN